MTRKHFKKLTETIHIINNDKDPMLVNGMNKWQFSLIVYFNNITFQEIIWSLMSWSKKLQSEEKSQEEYIPPPSSARKMCKNM